MSRVVTRARPSLRDGSRRLLRALAIALAVLPGVNAQELLITELVAVNDDTLLDEDGASVVKAGVAMVTHGGLHQSLTS